MKKNNITNLAVGRNNDQLINDELERVALFLARIKVIWLRCTVKKSVEYFKDIGMRDDRYDKNQTLFHILTYDNRPDVLTEIKRNIDNGTHMNKKL